MSMSRCTYMSLFLILHTLGCDGDEPPDVPADDEAARGKHCVVDAQSEAGEPVCFERFAEAVLFATGEAVQADISPAEYEPRPFTSEPEEPTAASYVIAVLYQYDQFAGQSLTLMASKSCASAILGFPTLSLHTAMSAKTYSGCKHAVYFTHSNYGGGVYDCGTSCSFVGTPVEHKLWSARFSQ